MTEAQHLLQLITPESGFDTYTIDHQKQVAYASNAIAAKMDLSDNHIRRIILGAAFHDIGKLFIFSPRLHAKPGRLDDDEYEVFKQHCLDGMMLLKSIGLDFHIYLRFSIMRDWTVRGTPGGSQALKFHLGLG